MSQQTRQRRIKSLSQRIKYQDDLVAKCKGKVGYACHIGNMTIAPGCLKHWPSAQYSYDRWKRKLRFFEDLDKRLSASLEPE